MTPPRICLALSWGGFRATCFGLGCLRALHDQDLLQHVTVISGISGGSVLAALYAYGPAEFAAFDAEVVDQLVRGLQLEMALRGFVQISPCDIWCTPPTLHSEEDQLSPICAPNPH